MMTVRHLEREWNSKHYVKLLQELLEARPEAGFNFEEKSSLAARTAAFALIRLEELDQAHTSIASALRQTLIFMQEPDGGWGDCAVTAICLRALFLGKGTGSAVDRGLAYLANLQQADGIWPAVPIRRMPADAATSAFILSQLADEPRFREAMRFDGVVQWFTKHRKTLDSRTTLIWDRLQRRGIHQMTGFGTPLFSRCA